VEILAEEKENKVVIRLVVNRLTEKRMTCRKSGSLVAR
jgi:hypothetical protein